MENKDVKNKASKLVREYSLQAEKNLEGNELAVAIGQKERAAIDLERRKARENLEWRQWLRFADLNVDDGDLTLERESKELAEAWEDFKLRLPESYRRLPGNSSPPSIKTVREAVEQTALEWKNKKEKGFGRARAGFFELCGTLDAHSQLFKIFPQGDKYTCLFSGVVSSIVKASARHEKIAEGFSRALSAISHHLDLSLKQCRIYPTPPIKKLVADMYLKYFKFLCFAMKWYQSSWNRVKTAFNQDFYTKEVDAKVVEVKNLVDHIVREAKFETQTTILDIQHKTTSIHDQMGTYMANNFRDISEQLQLLRLDLAQLTQYTLMANAERSIYDLRPIGSRDRDTTRTAPMLKSEPENLEDQSNGHEEALSYSRVEMEVDTRFLDAHIGSFNLDILQAPSNMPQVQGQIVVRLQSWLSSPKSQTLWIMGPQHIGLERSEVTSAAAHVTNLCHLGGIACISFFCKPISSSTSYITQFIALLYSLIRQLIAFAPSSISPDYSLRSKVSQLDGSEARIPHALSIINTLIDIGPRLLLVVIDGLQNLDHATSRMHIDSLLDTLQSNEKTDVVVKLLITTDGFFDGGKKVRIDDRLDCMVLPRKMPGRPIPGGQSLQWVSMPKPE